MIAVLLSASSKPVGTEPVAIVSKLTETLYTIRPAVGIVRIRLALARSMTYSDCVVLSCTTPRVPSGVIRAISGFVPASATVASTPETKSTTDTVPSRMLGVTALLPSGVTATPLGVPDSAIAFTSPRVVVLKMTRFLLSRLETTTDTPSGSIAAPECASASGWPPTCTNKALARVSAPPPNSAPINGRSESKRWTGTSPSRERISGPPSHCAPVSEARAAHETRTKSWERRMT
jgi:hypothetical protein